MKFLKYIWNDIGKLLYVIFITLVALGCFTQVIKYKDTLPSIVNICLITFISIIYLVAMYHPYKEWKDGLNSNK